MQLSELYRPRSWADVIGQDAIRAKVDALRPRGLGGRCYFLSGGSGQGKTSTARILAAEVADEWGIVEWKSPAELTADVLRWVDDQCRYRPMGRVVSVDAGFGARLNIATADGILCLPPEAVRLAQGETLGPRIVEVHGDLRGGPWARQSREGR